MSPPKPLPRFLLPFSYSLTTPPTTPVPSICVSSNGLLKKKRKGKEKGAREKSHNFIIC